MTINRLIAIAIAVVALSFTSAATVAAAEKEEMKLVDIGGGVTLPVAAISDYAPKVQRPAILPALYATLGVMQAWDLYSTRAALQSGAREANPTAAAFAGNAGSMVGLKAVTTASTIFFAERMWKKNKVGAVVMMVAINGATAAVSMHNTRNAKKLR